MRAKQKNRQEPAGLKAPPARSLPFCRFTPSLAFRHFWKGIDKKNRSGVECFSSKSNSSTTKTGVPRMDSIRLFVQVFSPVFSAPSFENFRYLMLAWIQTRGRAWITNFLKAGPFMPKLVPRVNGQTKHFSAFHRFFSRAKWDLDAVGRRLALLLAARLYEDRPLVVLVDDTLQHRTGPRILGAGMHYDNAESTYGGSKGRQTRFSFGLNFVTLALWIPVGFVRSGGIAVPVLFRLYRSKKTCPPERYRKRTKLAADLMEVVRGWWPDRQMLVVGDQEYCCKTVLRACDEQTELAGSLPMRSVLYDPEFKQKARGAKRIWGPRLGSIKELADDPRYPWKTYLIHMYGKRVQLEVKVIQAQWKSAPADRRLTVVLTRDPTGHYDDACFFRLKPDATVRQVLLPVAARWSLEQCYRDCKQHMRIESVQNGFMRGSRRADPNQPGPNTSPDREPTASRRTVPFGMLCYGFVVAWYLIHGRPGEDLSRAQTAAPWYTQKATISFRDMHAAFRRRMAVEQLWQTPSETGSSPFDTPSEADYVEWTA